ncbi:MAG: ATP-binding cassette domain-containing protein [Oscillospiraceae bacterium]|nr:ATP-binding cassette domain-containing protein [Oscillospiraceae bacterium]
MIELNHITKTFTTAEGTVEALRDVSLRIEDGDIYGVIGMSGAGKSTLVRCINMLERPTSGSVVIDGVDMGALSDRELREQRRKITMIFQGFNLLMQRNCLDNVCFPLQISGLRGERKWQRQRGMELLELVGLADKARAYPAQLSGGQQQRVAIARALATDPKVLLCDEATSALDPTTTASILELIRQINERTGITAILITHQMSVVESVCRHVAILDHGQVAETGAVSEVFAHPRSEAAKKLVYPDGESISATLVPNERVIRVVFNGSSASSTPLIAHMAVEKGIEANISYASTRTIEGREYGSMLLGIRQGENVLREAIEYLNQQPDVSAEEVVPDA